MRVHDLSLLSVLWPKTLLTETKVSRGIFCLNLYAKVIDVASVEVKERT